MGSWNILNVKYNFNEKWSGFVEGQVRKYFNIISFLRLYIMLSPSPLLLSLLFYDNFHYHEVKGGINFRPYKNFQITLAAGDYDTYREGGNFVTPKNNDEFRIWPQVLFTENVGRFKVEHRYRAELRFTSIGYRSRFRYRIGLTYPFGKDKKYQVGANNELFFTDKEPYFERNRSLVFLGYKMTKVTSFQLGFLHQFDYKINDETGRSFVQAGVYFEFSKAKRVPSESLLSD
ncbi:MAG: DUF2490 domain-containing protein [Arcicella sp.]|nr:DUF2490 domain-containing protein [Arcicella sp.]